MKIKIKRRVGNTEVVQKRLSSSLSFPTEHCLYPGLLGGAALQTKWQVGFSVQSATALLRSSTSTEALRTCVHRHAVCQLRKKKKDLFREVSCCAVTDFQLLTEDLISPLLTTVGIFLHPSSEA